MEIPASHLLAAGPEHLTDFLQIQFIPLKNGGRVISLGGVRVRVRDEVSKGPWHRHPQDSVITIIVVMLSGTGASREIWNIYRGGEGRNWKSVCLRV